MKKFKYKLEPLMKLRKLEEQREFANYSKVLGEINKNQEIIHEAKESQAELAKVERNQMLAGVFDLQSRLLGQEYSNKLARISKNAQNKIDGMKEESERLRKIAEKARQNRRILEILKEKKYAAFQAELAKNEYKELDEFNSRKVRERK